MHLYWIPVCTTTLAVPCPCLQMMLCSISDKDATRNHQGNSSNLIIGQHEYNFDLFRWMIGHSIVRYANAKEWGILTQFSMCICLRKVHRIFTILSHDEFVQFRNSSHWYRRLCNEDTCIFSFHNLENDSEIRQALHKSNTSLSLDALYTDS